MSGDDYARLGDEAEALVTWLGNEAFMTLGGTEGAQHCGALRLDPAAGTLTCSIYDQRPQVCRDLERGEGACRAERAAKGKRPAQALLTLTSRGPPGR